MIDDFLIDTTSYQQIPGITFFPIRVYPVENFITYPLLDDLKPKTNFDIFQNNQNLTILQWLSQGFGEPG